MGRTLRPDHEGIFHVTARSIDEERIFRCDADYLFGVRGIRRLVEEHDIVCHAFCVMPTHYHVVGWFPARALAPAIQRLNLRYARAFNDRHGRRGHVFDAPYVAVPVTTDEHFQVLAGYLANNPRDRDSWTWSSYPGAVGIRERFPFVDDTYERFFGSPGQMRAYVEAWRPSLDDLERIRGNRAVPGTPLGVPGTSGYSERRIETAPPPSATRSKPFRS